jgi:hypothetical protein
MKIDTEQYTSLKFFGADQYLKLTFTRESLGVEYLFKIQIVMAGCFEKFI